MSKIAIIDDDELFSGLLKSKIEELYPSWKVVCYTDMPEEYDFDGCLLDIELKGIHEGFEIANKLKSEDLGFPIIFISSHDELVCEGYKYSALRFIRKQYYLTELPEALEALFNILRIRQAYVDVKEDHTHIECRIMINHIQYIYSSGSYLYFLDKDNYLYRKRDSLKNFLEEHPTNLVKSSGGELINPIYIKDIDSKRMQITLKSGRIVNFNKRNLGLIIRNYTLVRR